MRNTDGDDAARAVAIALNDEILRVRRSAVFALGEIGGDAAIDYLLLALTDRSRSVRQAAEETLTVLKEVAQ